MGGTSGDDFLMGGASGDDLLMGGTSGGVFGPKLGVFGLERLVAMSRRGPASRLAIHKLAWVLKTFENVSNVLCVIWLGYEGGVQFRTI